MDTLGIEPNTSRKFYMLSERDNQLHHVPDDEKLNRRLYIKEWHCTYVLYKKSMLQLQITLLITHLLFY